MADQTRMSLFMSSNHFGLKLVLAPIIIWVATLISRRWGERIGGIIIGLPLTSAPVSIFFALEQGRSFAASAAKNAMFGLIPVAVFCISYAFSSRKLSWVGAAVVSAIFYLLAVFGISMLNLDLPVTLILVVVTLIAAILVIGKPPAGISKMATAWWDLPLRMIVAATLLWFITTTAGLLGPRWSGLLSPFPIFTFVMATFSHSRIGSNSAWKLLRGVLVGLFSYVIFFLIVGLLVSSWPFWAVYTLAAFTALMINGVSLFNLRLGFKDKPAARHSDLGA
jgi:hypothetical protein